MLVTKLPNELRQRWVVRSIEIQSITGSLAKFKHLVEFVQQELEIANSLFGLRNLAAKFAFSVVLKGKSLLQELCKRKVDWDEPVTSLEAKTWIQ